jgi:crotonobetainyl-CoA:carnitine CoA-transferase CaiB-like acyl-CoA transferase
MAAMVLADLGATVVRIDRPDPPELGIKRPLRYNLLLRSRQVIALDLKNPGDRETALQLIARADALIEGFRPGVTERLGVGPEDCQVRNPRLVYGRMTGWGQEGPLAQAAGHDLNYIALTGALHHTGRAGQPPAWPLNLLGDYAGGALYLALGILAAVIESRSSGKGQVVDAAIVDGTAHLMTSVHGLLGAGILAQERGVSQLGSAAPFYECYACADGGWVSVAPLESRFFNELLRRLGLDPADFPRQADVERWPEGKARLARIFLTKTRDEWCTVLEGSDACFAPVLTPDEAPQHPHMRARETYVDVNGVVQPMPAPRFSRTNPGRPTGPHPPVSKEAVLRDWGLEPRAEG